MPEPVLRVDDLLVVLLRAAGLRADVLRPLDLRADVLRDVVVRDDDALRVDEDLRVDPPRLDVLRVDPPRLDVLRVDGRCEAVFRAELLREPAVLDLDFDTRSGFPLRFVEAILSSSFSLMDLYMPREAPLSLLGLVLPRFAERAAPAAFCCAFDFAGITINPFLVLTENATSA